MWQNVSCNVISAVLSRECVGMSSDIPTDAPECSGGSRYPVGRRLASV